MSSSYIPDEVKRAAAAADIEALQPYRPEDLLDALTTTVLQGTLKVTLADIIRHQSEHSIEALLRCPMPPELPEDVARYFTQNTAEYDDATEAVIRKDSVFNGLSQSSDPDARIRALRARRTVVALSRLVSQEADEGIQEEVLLADVA